MGKTTPRRYVEDRVFLVIELAQTHEGDKEVIHCLVSIPGRDGTLRKSWVAPRGIVNQHQADDIVGWVALAGRNALHSWTGVQGVLPVE